METERTVHATTLRTFFLDSGTFRHSVPRARINTLRRSIGGCVIAAMGSDNPKGAVAKVSSAVQAGKYAGIAAVVLVLYVCLSTSPTTTSTFVDIKGGTSITPQQAQAVAAGAVGGRRAGDGARNTKDVSMEAGNSVGVEFTGGDHVTAQALPKKLGGGGGGASSLSSAGGALSFGLRSAAAKKTSSSSPATGLYALHAVDIDGVDTPLSFLQGKIALVVNVASE